MGEIPPWLVPPNFIGAAQAGASLGLQGRAQDIQEAQAADRLKLAYDTLAENERMKSVQAANALNIARMRNDVLLARNDALNQHYADMLETAKNNESARQDRFSIMQKIAEAKAQREAGQASVVEHPEAPGMKFLRNPSGAETPLIRPERGISAADKIRLAMQAQNMMKLGTTELPTDPAYQSRTNFAGGVLDKLQKKAESPSNEVRRVGKDGRIGIFDSATRKLLRYETPDQSTDEEE